MAAPGAKKVQLVGEFTHWQQQPISMQQAADGTWRTEIELAQGTHHYRFLVDGEWRDGPVCKARVPNVFGSQDCVCQVS